MLNSLVNQQSYSGRSRYAKGHYFGRLLFFTFFIGFLFLILQGFLILLQDQESASLPVAECFPVEDLLEAGVSGLPGATYRKNDLPIAHYWGAGELFLAWATPKGLGANTFLETKTIDKQPANSGEDGNHSLPVLPDTAQNEGDVVLAARAELKDMAPIGIYCTHTTESYLPTYGVAKASGERGGIYQVALALKDSLAKRGIPAVVCDTIHDYPDWQKSYSNSLASMEAMKKKYPGMEMFIDVHRDAIGSDDPLTTVINGEEVTRLMLVVGSNQRSSHPNWEQNLTFARKIGNALESSAPGILRSVRVQSGRYNQHISTKAILVEVGCSNSSLEQAEKGVDYLAVAIEKVLLAEVAEKKKATSDPQQAKPKEEKQEEKQEDKTADEKKNKEALPKGGAEKEGMVTGNDAMQMIKIVE